MYTCTMETIYLSIPEGTGSSGYLFHEIPGTICSQNRRNNQQKYKNLRYGKGSGWFIFRSNIEVFFSPAEPVFSYTGTVPFVKRPKWIKFRTKHLLDIGLGSAPFPHMPAKALRSGHVFFIVRGQMYDGRSTIHTACNVLFNVSYILCIYKYTFR